MIRAVLLAALAATAACHDLPALGVCGNGIVEANLGEACDDGGASALCTPACELACATADAAPPGYEPVLLDLDARIKAADLIEDELILALPVVPVKPGTEAVEAQWSSAEAEDEEDVRPNPFAALSSLKASKPKQQ